MNCPITYELMEDPVIDREGNTYEKKAIMAWLKDNYTSPLTRNDLDEDDLVPNRALKNLIEEFKRKREKEKNDDKNKIKELQKKINILCFEKNKQKDEYDKKLDKQTKFANFSFLATFIITFTFLVKYT
jgi:hypothetical protein